MLIGVRGMDDYVTSTVYGVELYCAFTGQDNAMDDCVLLVL